MVLSWLMNALATDIAHSVFYASSAQDVWVDLHDCFSQKNASRIFEIRRAISTHCQGTSSLASYYTIIKGFWDELASYSSYPDCTCGVTAPFQSPSTGLIAGIFMEERQRSILASPDSSLTQSALAAVGDRTKLGKPKPHYHYTFCSLDGHSESRCFKKHGYPLKNSSKAAAPSPLMPNAHSLATSVVAPLPAPSFSQDQYNQIISMLQSGNNTPLANSASTARTFPIWDLNTKEWIA
ncbi:uncharacterized protein LOC122665736 [Telopea speciosissima]|uniref:uncharacterized protein LOC122665736 n=1 Tax=Telopea speciosissima TaxID=54955 RepID=UPI001CC6A687|nr:uncharacterized protein LOC122665736 [Telopea speciosissima]